MSGIKSRGRLWPLIVIAIATIPVAGVFTLSRIFFVRDLTLNFRSRFLFFRGSVWSGHWPLWDPYVANGQSAVSDALYQLFHFPSLPIRLLLPEVVAYNTWIAIPIPLAALGAYLYLRRQVTAPAAAFGALAFALAGPTVSTTNFPNLSWSVACVPFMFWALDRLAERRRAADAVLVATVVAAQALAGEPVTLAATLAIAALYVVWPLGGWRHLRLLPLAAAALLLGVGLAALQFVPLAVAARSSVRNLMAPDDFWAFHPLALLELVVPHFFGDYFQSNLVELTWMPALNSGREPFYYTMYMGVPMLLAAALGALSRRPRTTFWALVVAGCLFASLGSHTPFYPALQWAVPAIRAFRFPVKYLSIAGMGIATLAAFACEWMINREVPPVARRIVIAGALLLAALTYGFIAWQLIAPRAPIELVFKLAVRTQVRSPIQAAEFLIYRARPLLTSLFLKLLCATFLLAIASSQRRERRLALAALALLAVTDLLAANSSVNPTMPLAWLDQPAWVAKVPPDSHERVYIGGRLGGFVDAIDVDSPKYIANIAGYTPMQQRFLTVNDLVFHPSGWHLREVLSYDLPLLWPLEHAKTVNRFREAPRADRLRFLRNMGTRYAILPAPAPPGAEPLAALRGAEQLQLYEFAPSARRAYIVPNALMGPNADWAIEGLFQPRFNPASGVLVSEPPPPAAGTPGPPQPASAAFLEDGVNAVAIRAALPADGYLVLLDSYDPDWSADVDGNPAAIIRGNGLGRAVHVASGVHVVTFRYHPRRFYVGAAISSASALILAAWWLAGSRSERRARLAARPPQTAGA